MNINPYLSGRIPLVGWRGRRLRQPKTYQQFFEKGQIGCRGMFAVTACVYRSRPRTPIYKNGPKKNTERDPHTNSPPAPVPLSSYAVAVRLMLLQCLPTL